MNEHGYIRSVTRHLPSDRYQWKIHDSYAGGVPDWFYEGQNQDLWVEWKYIKPFPKRPGTLIDLTNKKYLSALQQRWIMRRHEKRQDIWVIAGSEHGGVIFKNLDWQSPISVAEFQAQALKPKEISEKSNWPADNCIK